MLDIKFIRQNPDAVKKAIRDKNVDLDLDKLLAADERKRHVMTELEQLRAEQNKRSRLGEGSRAKPGISVKIKS